MKRFITIMFSFLIMLFGGIAISSNFTLADDEVVEFEINSPEQYVEVMTNQDAYNENAKIVLKEDIDLKTQDLGRVYSTPRTFKGVFDGNGYTISNAVVGGNGAYYGLIPYAENATIQNLRIQNVISFNFENVNMQDVYVGILVGYGKDVKINNCELDGAVINEVNGNSAQEISGNAVKALSENSVYSITIPTNSNVYFGSIIGKLSGRVVNAIDCTAQIFDCINYYDLSIEMGKKGNIYAGGIAGELDNASFARVINFGNLKLNGVAITENTTSQYLGGLAGSVSGSKATIKNSLSGGTISATNTTSLNKLYKGGIIGGNPYGASLTKNFNYDYYMDNTLTPSGDLFLTQSNTLCVKDFSSHAFLSEPTNFDQAIKPWDFNKTWSMNFHLQNFQIFTYVLNNVIDNRGVFAKAYFMYNGQTSQEVNGEQETGNVEIQAKFNGAVTICLEMKEQYIGWYILKPSGVHLNTNSSVTNEISLSEPEVGHYNITFNASLLTSGADYKGYYSFTAEAVIYVCSISISQQAITNNQGTYKIDAGTPTTVENTIRFSYDKRSAKITGEGKDQFTFDYWQILYKNNDGEFTTENKYENNIESSELQINYGEVPFDKEFKCVAYFTDDKAIKVSFGNIGTGENVGIKSIRFSGKDYDGNKVKEILVSPNNTSIPLQVVTNKGYKINVGEFIKDLAELYGDNSTDYTLVEDPIVDEETEETTYNFQLNMRFISAETLENNSLKLSFVIEQEGGGNGNTFLWIYITVPVALLLIAGVVVFIIIRHRRRMATGDDGGGSSKQKESKQKKESYKNYY